MQNGVSSIRTIVMMFGAFKFDGRDAGTNDSADTLRVYCARRPKHSTGPGQASGVKRQARARAAIRTAATSGGLARPRAG